VNEPISVLDKGYVVLVETWGSDERIIESARMSTAKGFQGWGPACTRCGGSPGEDIYGVCKDGDDHDYRPGDEKLLKFLWDNAHATPFEMAGLTIEVKAPIMVFREWHRHRVPFGYNEMSARYTPLPDENYMPTVGRLLQVNTASTNKQQQGAGVKVEEEDALAWLAELADVYEHAERVYKRGIELGIAKELARLPVPVGRYSAMRATANLRGWLGFLKLRCATGAQWEIRMYANVVADIIRRHFPRTHEVSRMSLGLP
jgi:thymidylate synthase (FAD)